MAKKELSDMSDDELKKELEKRGHKVGGGTGEFRVERSKKKEGVIVVWPSTRSRFPLSAKAMTWLDVLDHGEEIRELCSEVLNEDADDKSSSSKKLKSKKSKKKSKKKGKGKKKRRPECFGGYDEDSGSCQYCDHANACEEEAEEA